MKISILRESFECVFNQSMPCKVIKFLRNETSGSIIDKGKSFYENKCDENQSKRLSAKSKWLDTKGF